jgi:hypothetical protein
MQFADGKEIKFYLRCRLIHKYMTFLLARILLNNLDMQCEVYLYFRELGICIRVCAIFSCIT